MSLHVSLQFLRFLSLFFTTHGYGVSSEEMFYLLTSLALHLPNRSPPLLFFPQLRPVRQNEQY